MGRKLIDLPGASAPAAAARRQPLLDWLDVPRSDRAIRFADDDGGWTATTFDELATLTRRAGAAIHDRVGNGAPVVVILPTGPEFVATFFGALLAGVTPCPIAPPGYFQDLAGYTRHVARILATAAPSLIVTDRGLLGVVAEAARRGGIEREPVVLDVDRGAALADRVTPAELALLQFTSGSTGTPRGSRITWENLESNLAAITRWSGYDGTEAVASWLPLYHDMGLIGVLLQVVTQQGDLDLLRPDQFVRDPARWIGCFGAGGARLTAAPTFGFAYAAKRVRDEDLVRIDLSGWRGAILGAERVDAQSLQAFCDRFGRRGFRVTAFCPAYGMAEATLAITGVDFDAVASAVRLDPSGFRFGARLEVEHASLVEAGRASDASEWLVGCGYPLTGASVEIVDAHGSALGDSHVGEIVVEGPGVGHGYAGGGCSASTRFADGRLFTGDAGFLVDGELYVVGRIGDALSVHGRNVYLEDVEARLSVLDGIPKGKFVVIGGTDRIVAVLECESVECAAEAAELLSRRVGGELSAAVICAPRGTIARTSSGKPRRREMWRLLSEGELTGEVVAEVPRIARRGVQA